MKKQNRNALWALSVISAITLTGCEKEVTNPEQGTEIKALILYSNGVKELYLGEQETLLAHVIEVTNKILSDSKTHVRIIATQIEQYQGISDTDDAYTMLNTAQTDKEIAQKRNDAKADEVLIYRTYLGGKGACGLAFNNKTMQEAYAFALMSTECPAYNTAHEIGHNFGNTHSHIQTEKEYSKEQTSKIVKGYATGHIVENNFGTIMTYSHIYNAEQKLIFSNPDLECNGQPCGIEEGEVGESDASRSIRETKTAISEFR